MGVKEKVRAIGPEKENCEKTWKALIGAVL
jgi:hypothetical protein